MHYTIMHPSYGDRSPQMLILNAYQKGIFYGMWSEQATKMCHLDMNNDDSHTNTAFYHLLHTGITQDTLTMMFRFCQVPEKVTWYIC